MVESLAQANIKCLASLQNNIHPHDLLRDELGVDQVISGKVLSKSLNKLNSPDNVIEKNVIGLSIEPRKEKIESSQRTD